MTKFLLLAIILVFIYYNYAFHMPGFTTGRSMRLHQEKMIYPENDAIDCSFVKNVNFTAKVDNFDPNNTDTWNQVKNIKINFILF